MDTVAITGAAGRVGSVLRDGLQPLASELRLIDRVPLEELRDNERAYTLDLGDLDGHTAAFEGAQAVVHLGGVPDESTFDHVVEANIVGCYNAFEASRRAGVSRIVFASTNHVVGFYPRDQRISPADPPRPDSLYGVSKSYGEALARLYYDKWDLEAVCLRIGSFRARPENVRQLSTWLSHRDTVELARCAIETPDVGYQVVFGVSANDRSWWDNSVAEQVLGFVPQDNAEAFADEIPEEDEGLGGGYHGGLFVEPDYRGGQG